MHQCCLVGSMQNEELEQYRKLNLLCIWENFMVCRRRIVWTRTQMCVKIVLMLFRPEQKVNRADIITTNKLVSQIRRPFSLQQKVKT